jgi:hypothetical protein
MASIFAGLALSARTKRAAPGRQRPPRAPTVIPAHAPRIGQEVDRPDGSLQDIVNRLGDRPEDRFESRLTANNDGSL